MRTALITALEGHYGSGHYFRCLYLAQQLRKITSEIKINILTLGKNPLKNNKESQELLQKLACQEPSELFIECPDYQQLLCHIMEWKANWVIIDKRESPKNFLRYLNHLSIPTIIFDSRGDETKYAAIHVKSLPSLIKDTACNYQGVAYLPPRQKSLLKKNSKDLVAFFGYDDVANLSETFLKLCLKQNDFFKTVKNVYLFLSPYHSLYVGDKIKKWQEQLPFNLLIKNYGTEFENLLKQSQYFVGHFGISTLYAMASGMGVLFLHPSDYHRQLVLDNFPLLNLEDMELANSSSKPLTSLENSSQAIKEHYSFIFGLGQKYQQMLKDLYSFSQRYLKEMNCQVCHSTKKKVIYRNNDEAKKGSIFACTNCGMLKWEPIAIHSKEIYDHDYFLKEYQKSYGKTYQKDQKNIKALAKNRYQYISRYASSGRALDIGAALGYFLDILPQSFETYGVEISVYAADHCQKRHRLFIGDFYHYPKQKDFFEMITMWYVIEHFKELNSLLDSVAYLQKKNGVFALSTPNLQGISARFNREDFFRQSPLDHYQLLRVKDLRRLLKKRGYQLYQLVSTGIHYHRFKALFPILSLFIKKSLYHFLAKKFNLGDTMELYFVKKK